ncbi:hypothetical protein H310_14046 [Aphanomyces invadans]|uniref:Uncharacterized protein n=1 Tax=Aphanomyces invadans TaxID=157072 RepID=A0A024TDG5_9STRA|nr:hypothetical protein H310_14046 [Aphanomyces invadans]ETV91367.1 hypothetical protein H310_14046 [Aphanomyces invadans]|eukprot:XP_008879995.1 hypothetical protein H310_14046 [Aphanomyces invadans]
MHLCGDASFSSRQVFPCTTTPSYATSVPSRLPGHVVSLATLVQSTTVSTKPSDLQLVWKFAARNGHLQVIQYLHMRQVAGCTPHVMDTAAANGHLDIVAFLHLYRTEGCTKEAMDAAACKGFLDVVQFLHYNRNEGCTKLAMTWAARLNQVHVVRFLSENRTEGCSRKALDWAAKYGHLDVVKYLYVHRPEGSPARALVEAAKARQMDVVRYLALQSKNIRPWMHRAMAVPERRGYLRHPLVVQGTRSADEMGHVVETALETALDAGRHAFAHHSFESLPQVAVLK